MLNSQPLVSVIMGIYNCADTLAESLDSLLAQTYQNFEIIMCNDGSTDNTFEIAKQYKDKYPNRIVLIENEKNMGLNYTLNNCLKYVNGAYIARMDGDDISLPLRFEKEVSFLDEHPEYAIVSTPMIHFDENGDFKSCQGNGEPKVSTLAKGTPFCHAPCMVRKEAYDAVSGYDVDSKKMRVEDWNLWIRMYSKGYKGYNLQEPMYKMRDDKNAFSRRKFKFRINEARMTIQAVKLLKLSPVNYIYVLRPILVGLLPKHIYKALHLLKK